MFTYQPPPECSCDTDCGGTVSDGKGMNARRGLETPQHSAINHDNGIAPVVVLVVFPGIAGDFRVCTAAPLALFSAPMFETITPRVTAADQKLKHLRRFL